MTCSARHARRFKGIILFQISTIASCSPIVLASLFLLRIHSRYLPNHSANRYGNQNVFTARASFHATLPILASAGFQNSSPRNLVQACLSSYSLNVDRASSSAIAAVRRSVRDVFLSQK